MTWRWNAEKGPGMWLWSLFFIVLLLPTACQPDATPVPSGEGLHVTVSILPQRYFVERIGGEYVQVNVMVLPGESPATYEPKPEQLQALSASVAYFSIGVPFEDVWMSKIAAANPDMHIVDTAQGIERLPLVEGDAQDTAHPDPHIWLSPRLVKIQAQTIYQALAELDAPHQAEYRANLNAFLADIDALDADIRATLADSESRSFMVFHPTWGYFARDYDLTQMPIEAGGQEPSAAELSKLISQAHAAHIRVVLAQPEFSTRTAETIAREIDGQVLLVSPLAPDWLDNMYRVAQTFAEALGSGQ